MSLIKRPVAVTSATASRQSVFPRGMALPHKAELQMTLLRMMAEQSEGKCGVCEEPLLAHWRYCPSCGQAIDWDTDS